MKYKKEDQNHTQKVQVTCVHFGEVHLFRSQHLTTELQQSTHSQVHFSARRWSSLEYQELGQDDDDDDKIYHEVQGYIVPVDERCTTDLGQHLNEVRFVYWEPIWTVCFAKVLCEHAE